MLCQSHQFGDIRVTRVLEMSGPTHDPAFLFPDLPQEALDREAAWLAPHHFIPAMNRLVVTIQIWILHVGDRVVVVDPGIGNGKDRPAERQNRLNTLAPAWLAAAGAGPEAVTDVVLTHLHADHVGGCTRREGDRWVPAFPRARHHMPKADFDHFSEKYAAGDTGVNSGSWTDSVLPLVDAGLVDFTRPGDRLFDRLRVTDAAGHTPGQVNFWFDDGAGRQAVLSADIFHSLLQIRFPDLNTRYCILPEVARETRAAFLAEASAREALVLPMHFGSPYCGYIRREGTGYAFSPFSW
jgi:glyoxylase-like metal-dependent hydrolase (beta-lactamase superfamily II)